MSAALRAVLANGHQVEDPSGCDLGGCGRVVVCEGVAYRVNLLPPFLSPPSLSAFSVLGAISSCVPHKALTLLCVILLSLLNVPPCCEILVLQPLLDGYLTLPLKESFAQKIESWEVRCGLHPPIEPTYT